MYGESCEFNFIETFGDYGLLISGTSYLLYSVCSSCMCIHYLLHGSSIVKLALSLSSHSPILMNMMLYAHYFADYAVLHLTCGEREGATFSVPNCAFS